MKKILISLWITTGDYSMFLKKICAMIHEKKSSYVCVANVHMIIEAHNSPSFATIVNKADIVTPDGMPLVKSLQLLYGIKQDRIAGMDLLPDLLKEAEEKMIPVYFYGGTPEMIVRTDGYVQKNFPRLNVAGSHSPPFRNLSDKEEEDVIKTINESEAGFVFVALGCPKQETWMASMKGRINACMIGIGGALPVVIGMQKRAPVWMQKVCLEWLYRLALEPRRLFKRYAVTNSTFLWLLAKAWLKRKQINQTDTELFNTIQHKTTIKKK